MNAQATRVGVLVFGVLALAGVPRQSAAQSLVQARALCDDGRYPEATRALQSIVDNPRKSERQRREAGEALTVCRQRFLSAWRPKVDFLASPDALIARFNPRILRKETVFQLTADVEAQLGQQAFTQALAANRAIPPDPAADYVRDVASRLSRRGLGFDANGPVVLIDSPAITIMCPSGHTLVSTGLLRFVSNEGELAALIAHELAHGAAHHPARRLMRELQARAVVGSVASLIGAQSDVGRIAMGVVASSAIKMFVDPYGLGEELEADRLAAHILYDAGYDPASLQGVFVGLANAGRLQPIPLLATHPMVSGRMNGTAAYVNVFPRDRSANAEVSNAFVTMKATFGETRPGPSTPTQPPPPVSPLVPPSSAAPPQAPPAAAIDAWPPAAVAAPPALVSAVSTPSAVATLPVAGPSPSAQALPPPPALVSAVSTPSAVATLPASIPSPSAQALPPPPALVSAVSTPSAIATLPAAVSSPSAQALPPPPAPAGPASPPQPAEPVSIGARSSVSQPPESVTRAVSTWESSSGDFQIALVNEGGIVEAVVRQAPASWPQSHVKAGDVVFSEGRVDEGGAIRGFFINVPEQAECALLPARFAPATLAYDRMTGLLSLSLRQFRAVAPACTWIADSEMRTITFRRLDSGGR